MPIDLEDSGFDESVLHVPGAYEAVLQQVCEQELYDAPGWLSASENPSRLAEFERRRAEQIAALVEQRRGEPVHCRLHHLPNALLQLFPRGQRSFVLTPDGVVTLKPLPEERR